MYMCLSVCLSAADFIFAAAFVAFQRPISSFAQPISRTALYGFALLSTQPRAELFDHRTLNPALHKITCAGYGNFEDCGKRKM